jgi:hypothetical protein
MPVISENNPLPLSNVPMTVPIKSAASLMAACVFGKFMSLSSKKEH